MSQFKPAQSTHDATAGVRPAHLSLTNGGTDCVDLGIYAGPLFFNDKHVVDFWTCVRKHNQSISDIALDSMRDLLRHSLATSKVGMLLEQGSEECTQNKQDANDDAPFEHPVPAKPALMFDEGVIVEAWACVRTYNHSIPDEALDEMRETLVASLTR